MREIREAILGGEDPKTIVRLQTIRTQLGLTRPKEDYEELLTLIVDKNDTSKGPRQYEYLTARTDGTVFIGSTPDSTGPSSSDSTRTASVARQKTENSSLSEVIKDAKFFRSSYSAAPASASFEAPNTDLHENRWRQRMDLLVRNPNSYKWSFGSTPFLLISKYPPLVLLQPRSLSHRHRHLCHLENRLRVYALVIQQRLLKCLGRHHLLPLLVSNYPLPTRLHMTILRNLVLRRHKPLLVLQVDLVVVVDVLSYNRVVDLVLSLRLLVNKLLLVLQVDLVCLIVVVLLHNRVVDEVDLLALGLVMVMVMVVLLHNRVMDLCDLNYRSIC